ncbi:ATP-binding protein [Pararoseomonas baculiformis]|uniref:ATP-binding protein n=1 Tax=Pararoseomonas baculiformis TaxID=2820812 RepID=UPI003158A4F7
MIGSQVRSVVAWLKAALKMGRLLNVKTLAGFDFSFQPSLDRNRILTLAGLDFINRHEVVHFLGQPGCGKTHLAIALAVEAVQAGRSVYFTTLAERFCQLPRQTGRRTPLEAVSLPCRENGEHGRRMTEMKHATAVGGNMLIVTDAGAEMIAEGIGKLFDEKASSAG